jgi:hypothetical protein
MTMRRNLGAILSRVQRMSQDMRRAACDGNHTRVKVSFVNGDEPEPPWPDQDAALMCECGEPLTFRRVIHRLLP